LSVNDGEARLSGIGQRVHHLAQEHAHRDGIDPADGALPAIADGHAFENVDDEVAAVGAGGRIDR